MDDQERRDVRARERKRTQRLAICAGLGGGGLALLVTGLLVMKEWPANPEMGRLIGGVTIAAGIAAMIGSGFFARRFLPNDDTVRFQGGSYRDRVQRQRAQSMAFMPIFGAYATLMSVKSSWSLASGGGRAFDYLMVGIGPFMAGVILLTVAGLENPGDKKMKRLVEDELTLSFRHKALATGLAVAFLGMIVLFAVGLWRPAAAVAAVPALLYVTATAAALRYYLLDREADRG
ncbi:MAG: hypothetical protein B7Z13_11305 [Caulobacterales bacterium 32-67-6]|nr:MAG: hypothetical protein B7Z13_11305 [Caulobacterales bacterium 32-67-6]